MSKTKCVARGCTNDAIYGARCAKHGGEATLGLNHSHENTEREEGKDNGVAFTDAGVSQEQPYNDAQDTRRCEHIKEDGTKCKGWRVKGEALCAGHLGRGIAADPARYAHAGAEASAEVRQGRAENAKKRAVDVYRAAVEEHAPAFTAARVAIALDEGAPASDRLKAMEALENRALGRPTEHVEIEAPRLPSSVEEIDAMTPEERRAALREMTKRAELRRAGTERS